jgi:uncharacterized protein with HEPN domain
MLNGWVGISENVLGLAIRFYVSVSGEQARGLVQFYRPIARILQWLRIQLVRENRIVLQFQHFSLQRVAKTHGHRIPEKERDLFEIRV